MPDFALIHALRTLEPGSVEREEVIETGFDRMEEVGQKWPCPTLRKYEGSDKISVIVIKYQKPCIF